MRYHFLAIASLKLVLRQTKLQEVSGFYTDFAHLWRVPIDLLLPDLTVDLILVFMVEWRLAVEHDENDNTRTPDIHL